MSILLKIQKLVGSSQNTKTCRFFSKYKNLPILLKIQKFAGSSQNTKTCLFSKYQNFLVLLKIQKTFFLKIRKLVVFSNYENSLFLIQKHTPREASTRQRTEMSIEMEALNPNPERTDARPPLGRVGAPRVSRVMN